jgi:hypothetical protein
MVHRPQPHPLSMNLRRKKEPAAPKRLTAGLTGDHCISTRKRKSLQMQAFCECVTAHHVVAQTSKLRGR